MKKEQTLKELNHLRELQELALARFRRLNEGPASDAWLLAFQQYLRASRCANAVAEIVAYQYAAENRKERGSRFLV